jgi:hypothetical protein
VSGFVGEKGAQQPAWQGQQSTGVLRVSIFVIVCKTNVCDCLWNSCCGLREQQDGSDSDFGLDVSPPKVGLSVCLPYLPLFVLFEFLFLS